MKQLELVRPLRIEQRKHLRVHDAFAGRQPLHIAHAEARVAPTESEWSI